MPESLQVPPPPASPNPAVRFSRGETTGETVTIACKMPGGLILRIFEWQNYMEPMRDGTMKEARRAIPIAGRQFVVRGTWAATAGQAYNASNGAVSELLPGGFAISEGCPKDLWDLWLEQNKDSNLVKNGIIFAYKERNAVVRESKNRAGVLTGLEPLDKANPSAKMGGVDKRLKIGVFEQGESQ